MSKDSSQKRETKMNKHENKLNIRKAYGRESFDITLQIGQSVRFLTADNEIVIEVEMRNGKLYLMKHPTVEGHTIYGDSFGKEVTE